MRSNQFSLQNSSMELSFSFIVYRSWAYLYSIAETFSNLHDRKGICDLNFSWFSKKLELYFD